MARETVTGRTKSGVQVTCSPELAKKLGVRAEAPAKKAAPSKKKSD